MGNRCKRKREGTEGMDGGGGGADEVGRGDEVGWAELNGRSEVENGGDLIAI